MNAQRRKDIQVGIDKMNDAMALLEESKSIFETASEEERDAYENLPESIQESERGCAMEEAADNLDDIVSSIDDYISEITESVETAQSTIE